MPIPRRKLTVSDSVSSSISKITDAACDIDVVASKEGTGKILVHCSAGISRSPMVVAVYLTKRRGMTLKVALGQIVRVRPQISPNAGFLQQLTEMEVDKLPKREDRLALFEDKEESVKESPREYS